MSYVRLSVTWQGLDSDVICDVFARHVQYVGDGKISMASGKTLVLSDPEEEEALTGALDTVLRGTSGSPWTLPSGEMGGEE